MILTIGNGLSATIAQFNVTVPGGANTVELLANGTALGACQLAFKVDTTLYPSDEIAVAPAGATTSWTMASSVPLSPGGHSVAIVATSLDGQNLCRGDTSDKSVARLTTIAH